MAVLGLILLAGAAVLTAAVVTSNTGAVETDLWGVTVSDLTLGVVFVAGMITTVVAVAGLALFMGALRRGRRLRHERLELRRENERLAQRVEESPEAGEESPSARRRRWGTTSLRKHPTEDRTDRPGRREDHPVDTAGRPVDSTSSEPGSATPPETRRES